MNANEGLTQAREPRSRYEADPRLQTILEGRRAIRGQGPYQPLSLDEVQQACREVVPLIGRNLQFVNVVRLGGGGSKEQFVLTVADDTAHRRYVVRTDPLEAVTVSCRRREAEMIAFSAPQVPVPEVVLVDDEARYFRQPTMIMEFVDGVTKPTQAGRAVTGLGALLGEPHRSRLAPQFLDYLVRLHKMVPEASELPNHAIPAPESREAALWQAGFWSEVWAQDGVEPEPLITYVGQWLREHAPVCERARIIHGDYRIGNFLFDEASGRITSILDWELAHLGDYHEDVAHVVSPAMMVQDEGIWRASDLFEREVWLDAYQTASGLPIDPKTLHYYELLTAYKSYVAVVGTAISVANAAHSHQNILLTTVSSLGPGLLAQMCDLLENA